MDFTVTVYLLSWKTLLRYKLKRKVIVNANIKDISNQRFGRLTVINFNSTNKWGQALWNCQCDCGDIKVIASQVLKRGTTQSCGCFKKETMITRHKISKNYGESGTRIYRIWGNIKRRCNNKNDKSYHNYGGRGINLCNEWKNFIVFKTWAFNSGYSEKLTIDRIDNNKGYYSENCRWTTMKEQQNNKRNNHLITINGETKTLTQWSDLSGIKKSRIFYKLYSGCDPESVLEGE